MILIADSGSTKVHWCLVTASGQCSDVFTDGINPLFQTTIAMQNSISNQLLPQIAPLTDTCVLLWCRLYAGEKSVRAARFGGRL